MAHKTHDANLTFRQIDALKVCAATPRKSSTNPRFVESLYGIAMFVICCVFGLTDGRLRVRLWAANDYQHA